MIAATICGAVVVKAAYVLPNGVGYLEVDCPCFYRERDAFKARPRAVKYEGQLYGWSGWDSDRLVSFYRTDRKVAHKVG